MGFRYSTGRLGYKKAVGGETVEIVASEDTGMSSNASYLSRGYGTGATFFVGASLSAYLMRFDLSSISSDKTITSVSLKLTKTYAISTGARTEYIYGIKSANGDWIESTVQHITAPAGEPCWDAKEADGSGGVTTAWAGSAGLSTAGTDYESDAYGSFDWNREDLAGTQYNIVFNAAGISCVQSWLGTSANNYGLLIRNTELMSSYGRFATRENATAAYRPTLTITYS